MPRLPALTVRQPVSAFDLSPALDCRAGLEHARVEAVDTAVRWIDAERDHHIGVCAGTVRPSPQDYDGLAFGGSYGEEEGYGYEFSDDPLASGGLGPSDASTQARPGHATGPRGDRDVAEQVSGSNVQVHGVDEADIVKNDNKHVYLLAHGQLRIVQAWPPESARVVGSADVSGEPLRLFVSESEAVVFSSVSDERIPRTKVTVFDIRDRSQPRQLRQLMLPGAYVAARRIGSVVHAVVWQRRYPVLDHVFRSTLPPRLCRPDLDDVYGEVRDRIVHYIQTTNDSVWLPTVGVAEGAGRLTTKVGCNRYRRLDNDIDATTSVVSFDIRGGEPSMVSILDQPGVVYASPGYLYLAVVDRLGDLRALSDQQPSTRGVSSLSAVHRFRLDGPRARYAGSGLIAGEPINQFAMDEHDGRLRVAAHDGAGTNSITVLGAGAGSLVVEGHLRDIAPKEEIRSVRFVGNRGYVVTFRQVDPLFAFDLTGGQPRQLGELKIPGYATYIHPLGDNQLLTVGFGASDPEAPNRNDAVRLQLVDVQDPTKPRLAHVEVIGRRGSWSDVQREHLAFNYFAARQLLLLPITVHTQRSEDPDSGFTGLMAYRADMQDGFELLGQAANPGGWSTKRTIVMDDYVLSLTDQTLKVNRLSDLAQMVAEIPL